MLALTSLYYTGYRAESQVVSSGNNKSTIDESQVDIPSKNGNSNVGLHRTLPMIPRGGVGRPLQAQPVYYRIRYGTVPDLL